MVGIFALWLPILLSAVAVFIASSIVHMVLPHHRTDWKKIPDEDGFMNAMRGFDLAPGDYSVPCAEGDPSVMKSDAFIAKATEGPLVVMTVMPKGAFTDMMGRTMGVWFFFCVVVSLLVAYVTELAMVAGADYMQVFRFTGTVAFGFYALGQWPRTIWYKASAGTSLKSTLDSFLYGLMTAGVFGWLWPS